MADETTKPPQTVAPAGNPFKAIKFSVEIATKQNNLVTCQVTRKVLRGRFDPINLKGRMADDRFTGCPVVPGIVIKFDGAASTVEFIDPLSKDENEQARKDLQAAVAAMNWGKQGPEKPRRFAGLPPDKLKAHVYWVRRYLDNSQAELKDGKVPSMEEIEALPGRVERNVYDQSASRERFPVEIPQYLTPAEAAGQVG